MQAYVFQEANLEGAMTTYLFTRYTGLEFQGKSWAFAADNGMANGVYMNSIGDMWWFSRWETTLQVGVG